MPKYATAAERLAGRRAAIAASVERRAQEDLLAIWVYVPDRFVASDVGAACEDASRHWSEHMGVLARALARGWCVRAGDRLLSKGGTRTVRVYRWTRKGLRAMEAAQRRASPSVRPKKL